MTQDDLGFYVTLAEQTLFNQQLGIVTAEILFQHIKSSSVGQNTDDALFTRLKDLMARMESHHEKLEAAIAKMKEILPPAA